MFGVKCVRPVVKNISNYAFLRVNRHAAQVSTPPAEATAPTQDNKPAEIPAPTVNVVVKEEVEDTGTIIKGAVLVEEPQVTPTLTLREHRAELETTALVDVNKQQDDMLKAAMPFDEVPGPPALKALAKAWSYLPILSTQATASTMVYFINMLGANMTWNRTVRPFNRMFDKYGPVVRLQGPLGGDIVFLSRPEHIETVYRQEGRYPIRSSLDSIEQYRLQHRKLRVAGPFIMSGPEWESLRAKIELPLQRSVGQYCEELEATADEFLSRIRLIRSKQEEVPASFNIEIYKWSLEGVALVALDHRLGCLDPEGMSNTSETTRLLEAMMGASAALRKCESGFQLWRFFETPSWRKLVTSCDTIDRIVLKHIRIAQARLANKKTTPPENFTTVSQPGEEDSLPSSFDERTPLLQTLLMNTDMYPEDALTMVLDMLLIGVNSTAHAMGFLMYHLAQCPRVQRELFEELLTILPCKDTTLTLPSLCKMRFLQACVKESLRLRPPIPVMTRVLPKDIALHAYRIPKGTYMLMPSHVSSLREENFEDALKFKPERWLSGDKDIHPFAAIPFGHGVRSCLGRSLAELQLWLLTAKLVRNFRIEYHYGAIRATTRLIAMPDKPLKFRFVDRVD